MDNLIYIGKEKLWSGLAHQYDEPIRSSKEIVNDADLNWTVNTTKIYTDLHDNVFNYRAIYREDNNEVLGIVNMQYPKCIQNSETFNSIEYLMNQNDISVETVGSFSGGQIVFGCFKINQTYKCLDDDIEQYFVIVNDHTKPDGKVTILNTPIRIICQNTLSAALSTSKLKARIPIYNDAFMNNEIANKLIVSADSVISQLNTKSTKLYNQKLDDNDMDTIMDQLFPYVNLDESNSSKYRKTNERIMIQRETFINDCLNAEDLQNYKGTALQVFQALTDYDQHYYRKVDTAYDLKSRMSKLPGIAIAIDVNIVSKFLKLANELNKAKA